jgi:DNA polymerase-3 subunit delta'
VDAPPHPRDVFAIDGVEAAELAFLDALDRGRLHHAWLLTGPEGVGKATLAYRMARRLLGARPDPAFGAWARRRPTLSAVRSPRARTLT